MPIAPGWVTRYPTPPAAGGYSRGSSARATTKTPSTPADPADGFLTGVRRVLAQLGLDGDAVTAVSHGTTVATIQLLEGRLDRLNELFTATMEEPHAI